MSSGKISKKMLKKLGLSHLEKELTKIPLSDRIEDGKNRRRQHLQEVKNSTIKQEIEKGLRQPEKPEFFHFKPDSPDYSAFRSLILKKDWDTLEND